MALTKLFACVVSLSLTGTLLAIGLLFIKKLLGERLGANWHYCLWFALILRLIIPYTPSVSLNVFDFIPPYQPGISLPRIAQPSVQERTSPTTARQTEANGANTSQGILPGKQTPPQSLRGLIREWLNWQNLALIWGIGVLAIFVYLFLLNIIVLFKIKKLPVCEEDAILQILQECQSKLKIQADVSIVYDAAVKSPAICGLLQPKIIISPEIVKKLSPEELSYIFLHELSHLKRHDLLANGLLLAIQMIYWFNPIICLALRQMKQDCEIACDATALAALRKEEHKNYGQTIIRLLQLLSEPHWIPGRLGFISKFNNRRIAMISKYRKTTLKWTIAALILTFLVGCSSLNNPLSSPGPQNGNTSSTPPKASASSDANPVAYENTQVVYENTQYGFSFTLPEDWKGYSIITSSWQGSGSGSATVAQTGPLISIRDPRWTAQTPRQDIPIMVFTLAQWNSLQQGAFHIGAAPIGPSYLGGNNVYVFALPARYNYAFPPGYQEVETILKGNPLQPSEIQISAAVKSLLANMLSLAEQGKVINCDFSAKTNTIEDVEKVWGKADKTDYVAAAKGRYATYNSRKVVFGINKGEQIFEVRSYDSQLKGITLSQAEEILGTPVYDDKSNGQEIIGYTAGTQFKIELVFPQTAQENTNPVLEHYNVLYPQGTVNSMADDPGRQW